MKYTILAIIVVAVLGFFGYKMVSGPKEESKNDTVVSIATTTTDGVTKKEEDKNMYYVDLDKSSVSWYGAMVSGLKSHKGSIKISSGEGKFENGLVTSGKFVFDMNSIVDSDNTEKLITHLKSDDFFSATTYPVSTLEVTSLSTTTKKDVYDVKANLTIKGITKEIKFPLTITIKDGVLNATGKVVFNRANFDVKYGSKSFFKNLGDKVIKDEVEITLNLFSKPLDSNSFPSSI